jgi:hypothetical protein
VVPETAGANWTFVTSSERHPRKDDAIDQQARMVFGESRNRTHWGFRRTGGVRCFLFD